MELNRFWRARTYFFRGHNAWTQFFVAMSQFLIVAYQLFILNYGLEGFFPNIFVFAFIFMSLYITVATLLGRWDYKRGSFKTDATIQTLANPIFKKMVDDIQDMKENLQLLLSKESK